MPSHFAVCQVWRLDLSLMSYVSLWKGWNKEGGTVFKILLMIFGNSIDLENIRFYCLTIFVELEELKHQSLLSK